MVNVHKIIRENGNARVDDHNYGWSSWRAFDHFAWWRKWLNIIHNKALIILAKYKEWSIVLNSGGAR